MTAFGFKTNNIFKLLFIEHENSFPKFQPILDPTLTQNWYLQYKGSAPQNENIFESLVIYGTIYSNWTDYKWLCNDKLLKMITYQIQKGFSDFGNSVFLERTNIQEMTANKTDNYRCRIRTPELSQANFVNHCVIYTGSLGSY